MHFMSFVDSRAEVTTVASFPITIKSLSLYHKLVEVRLTVEVFSCLLML